MANQVEPGQLCEVVGALGMKKSPNLGLYVIAQYRHPPPDHSTYGPIWHCTGVGVSQLTDAGTYKVTGEADFAQAWLKPVDDDEFPSQEQVTKEVDTPA